MSEIHGRITYSAEDIQRIKAASFHDHVPVKAETPAIEIEETEHNARARIKVGKFLCRVYEDHLIFRDDLLPWLRPIKMKLSDIDDALDTLTRARELMGGK
jgi:hypothetical protein